MANTVLQYTRPIAGKRTGQIGSHQPSVARRLIRQGVAIHVAGVDPFGEGDTEPEYDDAS